MKVTTTRTCAVAIGEADLFRLLREYALSQGVPADLCQGEPFVVAACTSLAAAMFPHSTLSSVNALTLQFMSEVEQEI